MTTKRYAMGLFKEETQAAQAIQSMEGLPWKVYRVHSPFPSHKISEVLKLEKSKVGYFTLAGGILGFLTGFSLSVYTAIQWNILVSGKPIIALIPFFIIGFEFTILFGVLGNILGFLTQARLPDFKDLEFYDPRCSGEYFGILATCEERELGDLVKFFQQKGGEVKIFG